MRMKLKRMAAIVIAVMAVFAVYSAPITAMAAGAGFVSPQPYWANVSNVSASLSFSGTTARCYATVSGFSGTTNISGTVRLERKSGSTYSTVNSWSVSSSSASLSFSDSCAVQSGTYLLTISANVTRNGVTETVSSSMEGTL